MDDHTLALVAAAKLILDAIIFAIPDKWLAAHTAEQVIVNLLRRLLRPGAAALLLALLLAVPARADEPLPIAARPQAPVATQAAEAAQNAVPACPEPCAACGQRVGAMLAPSKPLPTWAQALIGVLAAGGAALTVYQQGHAAGTW